jgi:hypothetical protein
VIVERKHHRDTQPITGHKWSQRGPGDIVDMNQIRLHTPHLGNHAAIDKWVEALYEGLTDRVGTIGHLMDRNPLHEAMLVSDPRNSSVDH